MFVNGSGLACQVIRLVYNSVFLYTIDRLKGIYGGVTMKKVTVLLLVALFLFLPSASIAKGTQVVVFDDPVLETALRKEVGIPEGDVTDKDLAKVTSLGIGRNYEQNPDPNTQVQSIAVLAYCSKLSTLELNFQNITDISPLANLKKMKTLELGGNPIADITPLTNMTALETLKLFNCQAQDYSPDRKSVV